MRIVNKRSVCLLVLSLAGAAFAGEIVPDLSDGLAGFDSEYAATTTVGAPIYTNGVTLAAHITPSQMILPTVSPARLTWSRSGGRLRDVR